jgi:uncharacterized protein YfiM (DUF2279 family)
MRSSKWASSVQGEHFGKLLPQAGARSRCSKLWQKFVKVRPGGTADEFAQILRDTHYDGLWSESGEERLGEVITGLKDVALGDKRADFGATGDIAAGLAGDQQRLGQGVRQVGQELATFAPLSIAGGATSLHQGRDAYRYGLGGQEASQALGANPEFNPTASVTQFWQRPEVAKPAVEQLVAAGKTPEQIREFAANPTNAKWEEMGLGARADKTVPNADARRAFGENAIKYLDSLEKQNAQQEAAASPASGQEAEAGTEGTGGAEPTAPSPSPIPAGQITTPGFELTPKTPPTGQQSQTNVASPAVDIPDTRGQGQQYHGARGPITDLGEGYYSPANIYGGSDTLYTTDALDVANGYQRKKQGGLTYKVHETQPVKMFDMEAPVPPELEKQFFSGDDLAGEAFSDAAEQAKGRPNLRQVMDSMREISREHGASRDTVQEHFDGIIHSLRKAGYGGMQHQGGLQSKSKPHLVKIYFDPRNQIRLEQHGGEQQQPTAAEPIPQREGSLPPQPEPTTPEQSPLERGSKSWPEIVTHQALKWGMTPEQYQDTAKAAWQDQAELQTDRNAARLQAAKSLGLGIGFRKYLSKLESAGKDYTAIPKFDIIAEQLANDYPSLGWQHLVGNSQRAGVSSSELEQKLWGLLTEPGFQVPRKTSPEYHARVEDYLGRDSFNPGEFGEGHPSLYASLPATSETGERFTGLPLHLPTIEKYAAQAWNGAKRWLKKYATTTGLMPKEIFDEQLNKDHTVAAEMQKVAFNIADLRDAIVRESQGKPASAAGLEVVTKALQGNAAAMQSLPPAVQTAIKPLREQIDSLSRRMESNGLLDGKLELTIEGVKVPSKLSEKVASNIGFYLTRSYKMFDLPPGQWKDQVDPRIRAIAHSYIRSTMEALPNFPGATFKDFANDAAAKGLIPRLGQEFGNQAGRPDTRGETMATLIDKLQNYKPTDQEVNNVIDDLLYRGNAPLAMVKAGKLGSKDLSVLKARKNIAPEIRALFGEHTDPFVNYSRSVFKMASLIANHEMLTGMREDLTGKYFFRQDDPKRPEGFNAPIAAEGSETMKPLNGLMTHPDIKEAFDEAYAAQQVPWWLRHYMKAVYSAKLSKTVLYELVQLRNFVGNTEFALSNGHFNVKKFGDAFRTTVEGVRTELPGWARRGIPADQAWRDYLVKLTQLGVVDGSVNGNELRDTLRDAMARSPDVDAGALRRGLKVAETVYGASDNFWKVYGFENERQQLQKAYEKAGQAVTDEQLDKQAAEIVTNVYPTYSKIPEGVKQLRRFPFLGSFVSFPAEYLRTKFMSFKQATVELADPLRQRIGAKRLASTIATLALPMILTQLSRYILGMTGQDDKDRRRFVAAWRKNADLLWTSKNGSEASYVDLSNLFPSSYLRKPINAMLAGDSIEEAIANGSWEFVQPYIGEDIFTQRLLDVMRNKTAAGQQVWNPHLGHAEKAAAIAGHFYEPLEPGTVTQARRIGKAVTGYKDDSGQSPKLGQEIGNAVTGFRAETVDVAQSLGFKARAFARGVPETTQIYTKNATSQGTRSEAQLTSAYKSMEAARRAAFNEMHEDAQAAIRLGVPRERVGQILDQAGLSEESALAVIDGKYTPYAMGDETAKRIKALPEGDQRLKSYVDGRDKQPPQAQ